MLFELIQQEDDYSMDGRLKNINRTWWFAPGEDGKYKVKCVRRVKKVDARKW